MNVYEYVNGMPINRLDPTGQLAPLGLGCGIGFFSGFGGTLLVELASGNFEDDPRGSCCNAFCEGFGDCITGEIMAQFPGFYAGCLAGALGSVGKGVCDSLFCKKEPITGCTLLRSLLLSTFTCFAGIDAGEQTAVSNKVLGLFGLNAGIWGTYCANGGDGPQLGKACCTYIEQGEIWSESIDCPLGSTAAQCCKDHGDGWFWIGTLCTAA